MAVDRYHAFGGAGVFQHPKARRRLWRKTFLKSPIAGLKLVVSYYASPVRRLVARAWRQFMNFATIDESCWLGPNAWCSFYSGRRGIDKIRIGSETVVRGMLRIERDGSILVGKGVYVGDDCIIDSAVSVEIRSFTMLAHGVHVFDNDSHPLNWRERHEQSSAYRAGAADAAPKVAAAPVVIGEHAWIGFNVFIGKGVVIGDRSVVAACSVVTRNVPPDTLVAGNPAKVIRTLQ